MLLMKSRITHVAALLTTSLKLKLKWQVLPCSSFLYLIMCDKGARSKNMTDILQVWICSGEQFYMLLTYLPFSIIIKNNTGCLNIQ